jgi:hypothetical protein
MAPQTDEGTRPGGAAYRAYRLAFPLVRAFSALDALVPGPGGYAVAVVAGKPE